MRMCCVLQTEAGDQVDLVAQLVGAAKQNGVLMFEQISIHEDDCGKRRFVTALRSAAQS